MSFFFFFKTVPSCIEWIICVSVCVCVCKHTTFVDSQIFTYKIIKPRAFCLWYPNLHWMWVLFIYEYRKIYYRLTIYIYISTHTHIHVYIYIYIYVYVCAWICVYNIINYLYIWLIILFVYVCLNAWVYIIKSSTETIFY